MAHGFLCYIASSFSGPVGCFFIGTGFYKHFYNFLVTALRGCYQGRVACVTGVQVNAGVDEEFHYIGEASVDGQPYGGAIVGAIGAVVDLFICRQQGRDAVELAGPDRIVYGVGSVV